MNDLLKDFHSKISKPGILIARMDDQGWDCADLRPKESEVIQNLMLHNQQSHIVNDSLIRNTNHTAYFFNSEDTKILLDKIASNRKLKLNDFLLNALTKAVKELELSEVVLHLDLQKNVINNCPEKSKVIAYDLGKLHRKKLQSSIHLTMIPPLFDEKISVSFCVFADQLSLAVNGCDTLKEIVLETWIREINKQLFN